MPSAKSAADCATRNIGTVVGLAFALLPSAGAATTPTSDALQDWIAKSSTNIQSIDAANKDLTDLEPLRQAIGASYVVQLGEPSHGAGTGFEAKARPVEFLHERLGFDVLVWESGLYDVALTEASLRAGEAPRKAAQRSTCAHREATPNTPCIQRSRCVCPNTKPTRSATSPGLRMAFST